MPGSDLFGLPLSYLRVALRTMRNAPVYTLINIAGLAVGLTCCLVIMLYVEDELGYDRFHADADRIYRLRVERFASGGEEELSAAASAPMLPAALNEIPQIEAGVRLRRNTLPVRHQDQAYYESRLFFADAAFFEVFSFNLLAGDPATVLVAPNSLVLTQSMARKYFPGGNALGQTLEVEDNVMTVTGITADTPSQSHFNYDMLASFSTLEERFGDSANWGWWNLSIHTYLKLLPEADAGAAGDLLRELPSRHVGDQESSSGYRQFLYLQPLTDIHLHSRYLDEIESNSQAEYVVAFSLVAAFILVIACINFVNLSTARAAERYREVGIRKTLGAGKSQVTVQFLGETVLLTLVSLALALVLLQLALPLFNDLAGKSLSLHYLQRLPLTLAITGGAIVVGLLAGLYPALGMSRFNPVDAFKGELFTPGSARSWLRQSLVVLQFTVTVILIIGAVIAQRQLNFMINADLGFDKEQTVVINFRENEDAQERLDTLRESFAAVPGVSGVTFSNSVPGREMGGAVASRLRGMNENGQTFYYLGVDYDFIATYGLEMLSGRAFSRDMGADAGQSFIINEAAYKALGWTDPQAPVGEEVTRQFSDTRDVIGVVKDFNFKSLQYAVDPLVLWVEPMNYDFVSVKITTADISRTLAGLENVWDRFIERRPFDYFFLDEDFERQYRTEQTISSLLSVFTGLAIAIACLGLFALASFMTRRRAKEIAVRKVLGASVKQIITLLSTSFARPVLIAALVAVPLAAYIADRWLRNFVNRIPVSADIFLIAVAAALFIALATVAWQSIQAALEDPVNYLRSE